MPDEVILDVTTIEENVTVETTAGDVVEIQVVAPTGPTGATGPAGPNSVTSATTSDGTANLSLGDLEVVGGELYTNGEYSHIYTQGDGAEIFTIGTDAIIYTQGADAHISTSGDSATIYTSGASGSIYTTGANAGISTVGANATMGTVGTNATISTAGSAAHIQTNHASAAVKSTNFAAVESGGASLVDGSMQPCLTWSAGGRNLTIPSGTATTFNATSYTYGTGAAAAHRTALGLTTLATTTPGTNVANFLEFPTSANLASALTDENGTGGGFVRAEGATLTSPSIAGTAAFTGTTRPTSAGTGTPAATSLVTREDLQKEQARTISQEIMVTPAEFATSTASGGFTGQGQGVINMVTNLTASAYARASVTRDIGQYVAAGANAACSIPVAVAFSLIHAIPASANTEYRFVAGEVGTGTPRALGTNPLAGRGFGFRLFWSVANSRREIQVFAHNGSTYVESAATAFGATTDAPIATILLTSDGAGTIKLFLGIPSSPNFERVRAPDSATITLSGGPSNGVYDQPQFAHIVQNAATAPSASLSVRPSRCLISTGLIY